MSQVEQSTRGAVVLDFASVAVLAAGVLLGAIGPRIGIPQSTFWPALAVSVIGAALRVTFFRRVPVLGGVPARWIGSTPFRAVFPVWIASRILVLAVGFTAVVGFGYEHSHGRFRVADSELANLPARWDAGWYLNIAREGYLWEPGGTARQQRIAFFPVHPLLMRYTADVVTLPAHLLERPDLFGGGRARALWAGVLISALGFLGGCIYVYLIARRLSVTVARRAVILLALYPFAVFYSAPYSEGLFLLAAAGSLYHTSEGQLRRAGLLALMAGLTRSNGFVLSVALALVAIEAPAGRDRLRRLGVAALPCVGMLLYSGYVYQLTGGPFTWMQAQEAWGHQPDVLGFVTHRWERIEQVGWVRFLTNPVEILSISAVLLAVCALPFIVRRLSWAAGAYVLLYLVPPLLLDLAAIGRMTAVLFPVFIWLALALRNGGFYLVASLFAAGQLLAAAIFFTWGPLM